MSVKMKIMITAVFSIVISVVFITLIAVNSFNQAISTTTNRELEATINNKAVVTHTLLHSYATLLKALSTSSEVEDALIAL